MNIIDTNYCYFVFNKNLHRYNYKKHTSIKMYAINQVQWKFKYKAVVNK